MRAILNMCAAEKRIAKYVNKKVIKLKGEIGKSKIKVQVFSIHLSFNRTSRLKISKYLEEFNNSINQQDLIF